MLAQKRHKHTNGMKQNIISADIFSIGISLKFLLYMLYVNMHVDACEYICYSHTQKFIYIYILPLCAITMTLEAEILIIRTIFFEVLFLHITPWKKFYFIHQVPNVIVYSRIWIWFREVEYELCVYDKNWFLNLG